MNILRLTNEQAWRLRQLLAAHSNRISKEYGSQADDYSHILQQLYKDIPKVKEFEDELNDIVTDRDKTTDDVCEWSDRLGAWFAEPCQDKIHTCSKCGDYAVVKQNTEIHCYKCNDNVVSASSYEEAVKKWNEKNDGYVFVLNFTRNSTPNVTYL